MQHIYFRLQLEIYSSIFVDAIHIEKLRRYHRIVTDLNIREYSINMNDIKSYFRNLGSQGEIVKRGFHISGRRNISLIFIRERMLRDNVILIWGRGGGKQTYIR